MEEPINSPNVLRLLVIILLITCIPVHAQEIVKKPIYDSILKYRVLGSDRTASIPERLLQINKAIKLSEQTKVDSIISISNRVLAFVYLDDGNYDKFAKVNYRVLKRAKASKDSISIGVSCYNLGWYHQIVQIQNDSAYYYFNKSILFFEALGKDLRELNPLMGLSSILYLEKDYLRSEENDLKALKLAETLPETEEILSFKWIIYNRLASLSDDLDQDDEAFDYHQKAIDVANKMKVGVYNKYTSIHNMASIYRRRGDYKKALELYQKILKQDDLFLEDPPFYPLIIDNIAFTKFQNGDTDFDTIEKMLKKAYRLSDSLDDITIKTGVAIDLAKFYESRKEIDSSLRYANETYDLSTQASNNDLLLESLLVLSKIKPGEEGKKYLNQHIQLSDSLLKKERAVRNKFARVQFDTDQIEQDKERAENQRFWLLVLSIALVVTLLLLYIIISQRSKNKELKFEKDQQKSNEEIYNLMLSQQEKVDEARAQEKIRISEEMHDGILGRLFGIRLSLESLKLSDSKETVQKHMVYMYDLKTIEQDIRKISHDLNTDFVAGSGFMDIVESLVKSQTAAYSLSYEFYYDGEINWEHVSNKTKIHVYRILQETMQNIYKHAEATEIKISFRLKNDVVLMTISDNGKGFLINKSKKGIGLKNINSRVKEVHGTVEYKSEIDRGTSITIQMPYSKIKA